MSTARGSESPASTGGVHFRKGGYRGETEAVRELLGMQFIESYYAAETTMGVHSHSQPLLHVVLAGNVTNRSGRSAEVAEVAHVEFLPANTPHETRWRGGGKGFAVAFGSQKASEWFEWGMLPSRPLNLPPGLVSGLLLAARRECFANDLAGATGAESYLAEALAELLRLPPLDGRREGPSRRLRQAREILLDTYEMLPSLTEVARRVEVHPVYLARAFRRCFGETIGDCIRRRRIEAGCRLISCSHLSLGEIAQEVGFADQSHFTRTFKQMLGIPPIEYARLMRPAEIVHPG